MLRFVLAAVLCVASVARAEDAPDPFVVNDSTKVKVAVQHLLTREDARVRVEQLLEYWANRFGVKSQWRGFKVFLTGSVWGVEIRALFQIDEHAVLALAQDPGSSMTSTAKEYVAKKLKKYLHPTYER